MEERKCQFRRICYLFGGCVYANPLKETKRRPIVTRSGELLSRVIDQFLSRSAGSFDVFTEATHGIACRNQHDHRQRYERGEK